MTKLYDQVIEIQAKINASDSNNKSCQEYLRLFTAAKNYRLSSEQLNDNLSLKRKLGFLLDKHKSLLDMKNVIPDMRNADATEIFNKIAADLKIISVIVEEELPKTGSDIAAVRDLLSSQNNSVSPS